MYHSSYGLLPNKTGFVSFAISDGFSQNMFQIAWTNIVFITHIHTTIIYIPISGHPSRYLPTWTSDVTATAAARYNFIFY